MRDTVAAIADALGPWIDPIALPALRQLYFPLSRLWAAASVLDPADPAFAMQTGLSPANGLTRRMTGSLVAQVARRYAAHRAAEQLWHAHFFGAEGARLGRHGEVEAARRSAAGNWMTSRVMLAPLRVAGDVPPVRWHVPDLAEVETAYGRFLDRPTEAFAPPPSWPQVEVSQAYENGTARIWWVRFPSPHPRLADMTIAKIVEPLGMVPIATLVAGNGVCIEPEMYPTRALEIAGALAGRGLRVIELTSPWHGRRTPPGWYGGERLFAAMPLGALDLFIGQVWETAVLIEWSRRTFGGRVGLVGVSMSALAGQLLLSHAASWTRDVRPDAAMLMLHSSNLEEVAFAGELLEAIGITDALARAGWSRAELLRWTPLITPTDSLCLPPDRLVSLLASRDRVMPVAGGLAQLDRWRVPAANRFLWSHSHMSVPAMLRFDDAPIRRFIDILTG
jgi:hypothetical protein